MTDDPRAAIAGVFDRSAPAYDAVGVSYFSDIARLLLDDVALAPGERLLDVGCGRGAVALRAAERVGPGGAVTGIDLAPTMVELTAAAARERGLAQLRVEVMDAQEPTLPEASYDVVTASLVAFFLPDPAAGLRAWRRLLVDGGRLGMTSFAGDDNRWDWLPDVFAPHVPEHRRRRRHMDDGGPFSSTARVEELVRDAGFRDPSSVVRTQVTHFADEEQWHAWSWSHGMRGMWEQVPDDRRDEVRAQAFEHLAAMRESVGGLVLEQDVRYTVARR